MTLRSRLPLHISQIFFQAKDSVDSFLSKLEVIADSKEILYSIRILIVVLALLMGYVHTPKENVNTPTSQQKEIIDVKAFDIP